MISYSQFFLNFKVSTVGGVYPSIFLNIKKYVPSDIDSFLLFSFHLFSSGISSLFNCHFNKLSSMLLLSIITDIFGRMTSSI